MWPIVTGLAVVLAQATQPGPGSKSDEWCFDRGQGAQLCEATQAACDQFRQANPEIARSPCRRVEPPEVQVSPTEPPAPPNPERQTPTQRWSGMLVSMGQARSASNRTAWMSQSVADGLDADTGREWSDAELTELGNMLVRGLSIEEIAQLLRRDHRQVRDKVAEVGGACRVSASLTRNRQGL
jgi:hypothetical protein